MIMSVRLIIFICHYTFVLLTVSISKLMSAEFISASDKKQEPSLNIHYIKDCKEKKLIHNILTLSGSESDCRATTETINNLLVSSEYTNFRPTLSDLAALTSEKFWRSEFSGSLLGFFV